MNLTVTTDYLDALSYEIRGAAMDVYNFFGPGLLESIYEKAMIEELKLREIKVESQVPVAVAMRLLV